MLSAVTADQPGNGPSRWRPGLSSWSRQARDALAHGLPVVLLPRGAASRLRMARACAARGVAAVVDGTDPAAAIRTALAGEHARQAAELARELAAAPGPAQVVETLERALG